MMRLIKLIIGATFIYVRLICSANALNSEEQDLLATALKDIKSSQRGPVQVVGALMAYKDQCEERYTYDRIMALKQFRQYSSLDFPQSVVAGLAYKSVSTQISEHHEYECIKYHGLFSKIR